MEFMIDNELYYIEKDILKKLIYKIEYLSRLSMPLFIPIVIDDFNLVSYVLKKLTYYHLLNIDKQRNIFINSNKPLMLIGLSNIDNKDNYFSNINKDRYKLLELNNPIFVIMTEKEYGIFTYKANELFKWSHAIFFHNYFYKIVDNKIIKYSELLKNKNIKL